MTVRAERAKRAAELRQRSEQASETIRALSNEMAINRLKAQALDTLHPGMGQVFGEVWSTAYTAGSRAAYESLGDIRQDYADILAGAGCRPERLDEVLDMLVGILDDRL